MAPSRAEPIKKVGVFISRNRILCAAASIVLVIVIVTATVVAVKVGKKAVKVITNSETSTVTTATTVTTSRPTGAGSLCNLSKWDENGVIIAESLHSPRDLIIDGEYLYVSETMNNRLIRYHLKSTEKRVILDDVMLHAIALNQEQQSIYFSRESGNEEFIERIAKDGQGEASLVVSSDYIGIIFSLVSMKENLYICDRNKHRVILWWNTEKNFTIVAGGLGMGSAADQLRAPEGISVDTNDNIYVADTLNHRIQVWSNSVNYGTTVAGNIDSSPGESLNELHRPRAIFVVDETMFIADSGNNRILKWKIGDRQGSIVVGTTGTAAGGGANQLNDPTSLKLDAHGNLYVVDKGNSRIQKYIVDNTLC